MQLISSASRNAFSRDVKPLSAASVFKQYIRKVLEAATARVLHVFFKKSILENYAIAVNSLQLYQKETPTEVFSCEFCEIFKNTFF